MDIKEVILTCTDYIEKNIHERITLDDLSRCSGLSKYYLHRVFKSLTGESLIDYIQSRKLASSISELTGSQLRIIDIALDYGFEYEQSYIRAFRKKFGCTPYKVRQQQTSLIIKEKISISDLMSVSNSIVYRPFFVFKPKFNLVGSKHLIQRKSGDNTANTYGRDFYYHHREKISNAVNPGIYYGFTDWSNDDDGFIYYMPSLEVRDLKNIPENMTGFTIPPHKYVVFRFVGFFRPDELNGRQVGRLLVHMYSKWIFNSGFRFADTFRFEYIDAAISKDNYCELDIYQPIVSIDSNSNIKRSIV